MNENVINNQANEGDNPITDQKTTPDQRPDSNSTITHYNPFREKIAKNAIKARENMI